MFTTRSTTFVVSLTFLAVAACAGGGGSTGSGDGSNASATGCQTDKDCTAPRVCADHACVDPTASPTMGKGGSGAAAGTGQGPGAGPVGMGGAGTGASAFGGGGSPGAGGNGTGASSGSGTAGSAAATCDLSYSDAACDGCYQSKCKTSCAACSGNPDCVNLVNCIGKCTTTSCVDSCGTAFSKGVADYNAQASCAFGSTSCGPLCDTGRDLASACKHDYQCTSGACTGADGSNGWCTTSCSNSNQCGSYAYCSKSSAGQYSCFPACTVSSDCSYIGPGVTCNTGTTAEGYNHTMCAYWN